MELKFHRQRYIAIPPACSNRTFMELKSRYIIAIYGVFNSSNRTFMELKLKLTVPITVL